jgi:secreted trypsin-like serine protease
MRERAVAAIAALFAVGLLAVGPAGAITNGTLDGTVHPEVGAMLADFGDGNGLQVLCTGTLISPRVFLSAGHCTDYLSSIGIPPHDVWVTFDPHWDAATGTTYRGTYFTDPAYGYSGQGGSSDPHDLAVVVLDQAISGITPAQLPRAGVLDRLPLKSATLTTAGYGTVRDIKTTGPHAFYFDSTRRYAQQSFRSLEKAWLNLSENPSTGSGGTCYGDSGGPHFYGGVTSDQLVATTITGDTACRASDKDYRLDTASAASFLAGFAQYGPYTYWG